MILIELLPVGLLLCERLRLLFRGCLVAGALGTRLKGLGHFLVTVGVRTVLSLDFRTHTLRSSGPRFDVVFIAECVNLDPVVLQ